MSRQAAMVGTVLMVGLGALAPLGQAEITSIAGRTEAQVNEFRHGVAGDTDQASESYPGTSMTLPLQVIALLTCSDPNEPAAAAAAAQFADPREPNQPNPEEFAISLALDSVSPNVRYTASALSQETRGVLFAAAELSPLLNEGDTANLTGRLFLDGALTIFATDPDCDLTGAAVLLRVTVVKSVEGQEDETVFSGEVELRGTTAGEVTVAAEGNLPTDRLILTDLSSLSEDFAAFSVLIIPSNTTIDYSYSAIVGQPFTLVATVEVEAANVAGESGVAAVIGTPTDTLTQVIDLTQGQQAATKTLSALENERENPSGELAFPEAPAIFPLFPLCGVLGFEGLIGVAALVGLRRFGMPHMCR